MRKFSAYLILLLVILAPACNDDDTGNAITPREPDSSGPVTEIPSNPERVDYELLSVNNSGVSGIAAFIPNEDGSTTIYIELENATENIHPARVVFGSIDDPGSVAITLNDCECKISETLVTQLDNGQPITFVDLMAFDGHLNIYQSPSDNTVIAHTNIGANTF